MLAFIRTFLFLIIKNPIHNNYDVLHISSPYGLLSITTNRSLSDCTMNVSTGLSLVGLITLLGVAGAMYEEDLDYLLPPEDEQLTSEKRYYVSPSCRRCLHNPNDYSACIQCYSRPGGPTPYFGLKKRAFDDLYSFLPKDYDNQMSKRGSFLACKCCLSLGRSKCCDMCNYRGKRGYQTSFVSLDSLSGCGCCSAAMFDFSCCLRCRSRK